MKEHPILFSGPMVRAILSERKSQTRRVMPNQPIVAYRMGRVEQFCSTGYPQDSRGYSREQLATFCPYGEVGSHLWVRETFWPRPFRTPRDMREGADTWPRVIYDADKPDAEELRGWGWKRKPSIFMPRKSSRITLEITTIRVERLLDISESDARAEGVTKEPLGARMNFMAGWDSINGKRKGCKWSDNPWVWVIEFKRVEP